MRRSRRDGEISVGVGYASPFVRLDSINLRYWNSTATLVASTNIIERNCLLARMGLGIGLHYGGANGNDCRLSFGSAIGFRAGLETLAILRPDKLMWRF